MTTATLPKATTVKEFSERRAALRDQYLDAVMAAACDGVMPSDDDLLAFQTVLCRDTEYFLSDVRKIRRRYDAVKTIEVSEAEHAKAEQVWGDRSVVVNERDRLVAAENERHKQRLLDLEKPLEEFDRENSVSVLQFSIDQHRERAKQARILLDETADPSIDARIAEAEQQNDQIRREIGELQKVVSGRSPVRGVRPRTPMPKSKLAAARDRHLHKASQHYPDSPTGQQHREAAENLQGQISKIEKAEKEIEQLESKIDVGVINRLRQSKSDPANFAPLFE